MLLRYTLVPLSTFADQKRPVAVLPLSNELSAAESQQTEIRLLLNDQWLVAAQSVSPPAPMFWVYPQAGSDWIRIPLFSYEVAADTAAHGVLVGASLLSSLLANSRRSDLPKLVQLVVAAPEPEHANNPVKSPRVRIWFGAALRYSQ